MKLNSIEGILFLIEFTNYHISNIYNYLDKYETLDEMKYDLRINNEVFNELISKSSLVLEKTIYNNIKMIKFDDKDYPLGLHVLENKPPILFYKGNLANKINLAAVIGTRENTEYGKKLTEKIVTLITEKDYGIVSGLALGIDTIAHKKALNLNKYTIAVLPCSLDSVYPSSNYYLANEILASGGALLSELPIGITLGKARFVQRNRIQSALSNIIIPVELQSNSGTVHTIKFAIKQNKKVCFLLPPINHIDYQKFFKSFGLEKLISELQKKSDNVFTAQNGDELLNILLHEKNSASNKILPYLQSTFDF